MARRRPPGRPRGSKTNPLIRRHLKFKQSEIERGIRAANSEGMSITQIDIEPTTGRITLTAGPPIIQNDDDAAENKKRPA